MKFSESWLRHFVNPACSGNELSHLLTMAGLEVEEESASAPPFTSVIVGLVLSVDKHPDADRLNVCQVDIGSGTPQQIVCGAPNVTAGIKVPCALPGAQLPGVFLIKIAKVRGVESSGMLCSAKELGIAEDASGLFLLPPDAPIGENLRTYLDLDDCVRTLKLTPNRADCLSVLGIAREVSALTGAALKHPSIKEIPAQTEAQREIILAAPQACPRYCGRVISAVNARAETPLWMRRNLERSGIRPISALVDITNYVMLEHGQPLHAFDNAKLSGAMTVRLANSGEPICLLNGQAIELQDDVLVIADEHGAQALAGIMGGQNSAINLDTSELFLESAFFAPKAIAGRARRYGFVSDAAHRFERGVDFVASRQVLERATELVLEICGGAPGALIEAAATPQLPLRNPVRVRSARVCKVLGIDFTPRQISEIFTRLNLPFTCDKDDFIIVPPSHRFDLEIEVDCIEEIARVYGYENIPSPAPRAALSMLPQTEKLRPTSKIRQILADRGFQEVINFAFVDAAWERDFSAQQEPICLANPIASNMGVMRSSLIGGLIANVVTNLKRKQNRIRIFETGRCFSRSTAGDPIAGYQQPWKIGALIYGGAHAEQWGTPTRNADFYDLKGELELLLAPALPRFEKAVHPALHPGRSAQVFVGSQCIGFIGELHPEWQQKYNLPIAANVFELDLSAVKCACWPSHSEISKQPPVIRDLAIVVDQKLELQQIVDAIAKQHPALIQDVKLFDVYTGKGVPQGRKSLAFRILMQDTQRTLQDSEVEAAMQALSVYLQTTFAAQLRV